jgi:hypothetical protein
MIKQLKERLENRLRQYIGETRAASEIAERKRELLAKRGAEIVQAKVSGKILNKVEKDGLIEVHYRPHFKYLIRQGDFYYLEEETEDRKALFQSNFLIQDMEEVQREKTLTFELMSDSHRDLERIPYKYDRRRAVQYAETWWNDYNPQFKKFDVDCTNYVSQCMWAGGAPMRGYPNRSNGWWYRNPNWSYSWSVAHALRWYLATSKTGLQAKEVKDPTELLPGDVICYDFQGDGRFDHNTIVVAKDLNGEPLVNAHTYNSRMRYWAYKDSTAYTDNIQYKFYTIVDDPD